MAIGTDRRLRLPLLRANKEGEDNENDQRRHPCVSACHRFLLSRISDLPAKVVIGPEKPGMAAVPPVVSRETVVVIPILGVYAVVRIRRAELRAHAPPLGVTIG